MNAAPLIIRAITLHQPHASLIAMGIKPFETRSWPMPHGIDYLAIHAGQKIDYAALDGPDGSLFRDPFKLSLSYSRDEARCVLPEGIVCVVRPEPSIQTGLGLVKPRRGDHRNWHAYGDFRPGRYAWPLTRVVLCQPPIQCKGFQRTWKLPAEVERVIWQHINQSSSTPRVRVSSTQ